MNTPDIAISPNPDQPDPFAAGLIQLDVPVPPAPLLEDALEYVGHARYLGLYWEPSGDEAMVDDGLMRSDASWQGYIAYTRHITVAPALVGYELGGSDALATHLLVLDRHVHVMYAGTWDKARAFLYAQWQPRTLQPRPITDADLQQMWQELVAGSITTAAIPTVEDLTRHMDAHLQKVNALLEWLTAQIPGGDAGIPALTTLYISRVVQMGRSALSSN